MSKDEYLITDAPLKALTVFAMPMILGSFFQQVYNMADSIIVGQFVGSSALAAVGACAALTNVFICVALGAGVGAGVLVSRYFGAKEYGKMKTIVSTSLISFLLLSILLGRLQKIPYLLYEIHVRFCDCAVGITLGNELIPALRIQFGISFLIFNHLGPSVSFSATTEQELLFVRFIAGVKKSADKLGFCPKRVVEGRSVNIRSRQPIFLQRLNQFCKLLLKFAVAVAELGCCLCDRIIDV